MNGKVIATLAVLLCCAVVAVVGSRLADGEAAQNPQKPAPQEPAQQEPAAPEEPEPDPEPEPEPEEPSIDLDSWNLLLANVDHPLPEDWTVETAKVQGSFVMDTRVVEPMKEMIQAAADDGIELMICSSYRSVDRQTQLFQNSVQQYMNGGMSREAAEAETAKLIAIPGTSEHQSGLAADIVTPTYQNLDEGFAETAAGKWLVENAPDYGFILRYPKGKEDITKIEYESWHFRYVGVEHAKAITEQGLCLEEYLEQEGA